MFHIALMAFLMTSPVESPSLNPKSPAFDFYFTIYKIIKEYAEPSRIIPARLMRGGLQEVARRVPEVVLRHDRSSWTVQVTGHTRRLSSMPSSPWNLISDGMSVLSFIQKHVPHDVKSEDVIFAFLNGLLSELDPHSQFMSPKDSGEMRIHTEGQFGGIGVVVSICSGTLTAVKVTPRGPASKAGLKDGDRIVRIDGQDTSYMSLSEAVSKMRGTVGAPVTLDIVRRKGRRNIRRKVRIVRGIIKVDETKWRILSTNWGKVGYVKIPAFQMQTANQFKKALEEFSKADVVGVVIDLRDNGGGLLDAVLKMLDMLIDSGTILATIGAADRDDFIASTKNTIYRGPVAVLVNGGSASASEIMTGAIKYMKRGIVIGQRTFGKASVQRLFELPDKSILRLTIAQYFPRGDVSIQGYGIVPDIVVKDVKLGLTKTRPVIYYSSGELTSHEADYKAALRAAHTLRKDRPMFTLWALYKPRPYAYRCEYCGMDPDAMVPEDTDVFQEDAHIRIGELVVGTWTASHSMKRAISLLPSRLEKFAEQEDKAISKLIRRTFGIDWKKGKSPNPSKIKIAMKVTVTPIDMGQSSDGKWGQITVTVTNHGKKAIPRLRAQIRSTNSRLEHQEILMGMLPKGASITKTLRFKIPHGTSSRTDVTDVFLYSGTTYLKHHKAVLLNIRTPAEPRIKISYSIKEKGDGDGILEKGEQALVKVQVTNEGQAPTGEANLTLKNQSWPNGVVSKARMPLYYLKPGKKTTHTFIIKVRKNLPADRDWQFSLSFRDCHFDTSFTVPVRFRNLRKFASKKHEYSPPNLLFSVPVLLTSKPVFSLKMKASDSDGLRDVYSIVYNFKSKIYGLKEFYQPLQGRTSADIDARIPVYPGANIIRISVRDKNRSEYRRTIPVVYYPDYTRVKW